MELPFAQAIIDDHFTNGCNKNIECILPTAEMLINFRTNGIKTKKCCFVYAEKIDFKSLIQIRVTEKSDQRRMFISTIDSANFSELKQDQSLHVTFAGFVENLIRLLQDCQAGKLEIYIVQQQQQQTMNYPSSVHGTNAVGSGGDATHFKFEIQFLELRPFKNLVHLCLPCRLAPLNVVLFYMNNLLDGLQSKLNNQEDATQQLQHELSARQRRCEQLETENLKLRDNLQQQAHNLNQKQIEELKQLQESICRITEQHHADNERNRKTITKFQTQLEHEHQEKLRLQTEKSEEIKRNETLNAEVLALNTKITSLKSQDEQRQTEVSALKNEARKTEMHLNEARKLANELQEGLKKHDKNKADIIAELEAEKNISQTKRKALEVATEEISKANEIIFKQAQELLKLKKTVAWRTEIALEQEKAMKEREREVELYEDELKQTRLIVSSLREEIPKQLKSLNQFANSLETKYRQEIDALRQTLQTERHNANFKSKKRDHECRF